MINVQAIKFYKSIVGNTPPRYSILICNEETTLEELLTFLFYHYYVNQIPYS